jgi:hypothetical protein
MPLDGEVVKNQLRLRRKGNNASVDIRAEQQLLITIPPWKLGNASQKTPMLAFGEDSGSPSMLQPL